MLTSQCSPPARFAGLDGVAAEAPPSGVSNALKTAEKSQADRVSGDESSRRFVIAASSAGSSFPSKSFAFAVHSIFHSALNLRIETDVHLISLIANPCYAHPRGAVVNGACFDEWTLERGTQGFFDGYCLSFWAARAPRILIGPSRADAEERSPAITYSAGLASTISLAASLIADARAERGSKSIVVGPELSAETPETELGDDSFIGSLRAAAEALSPAFVSRSIPAALRAAEGIVGLGTGLTPAGDDFLCGFLAARRSLAFGDGEAAAFLEEWGRRFAELGGGLLSHTNEISAEFLWSAAEGRFSSALVAFAHAIGMESKRADELSAAVSVIGSIGHGSGLDAAEGFLYGLQAGGTV